MRERVCQTEREHVRVSVCEHLSLGAEVPALPAVGTTSPFEAPGVEAGSSTTLVLGASPSLDTETVSSETISALRPPGTLGKPRGQGGTEPAPGLWEGVRGGFEALSMALEAAWLFR